MSADEWRVDEESRPGAYNERGSAVTRGGRVRGRLSRRTRGVLGCVAAALQQVHAEGEWRRLGFVVGFCFTPVLWWLWPWLVRVGVARW